MTDTGGSARILASRMLRDGDEMVRKHSLTIRGHRTSVSVEDAFWQVLKEIAVRKATPLAALVAEVDALRKSDENLSSAIRLYVLDWALEGRGVAERHHR